MPERSFRVLRWSLAWLGLAADQASHYVGFAWLRGVDGHTFALFQTEPESRYLATVPAEQTDNAGHRGFFIEVAFREDASNQLRPYVNQGALFGWKAGL